MKAIHSDCDAQGQSAASALWSALVCSAAAMSGRNTSSPPMPAAAGFQGIGSRGLSVTRLPGRLAARAAAGRGAEGQMVGDVQRARAQRA